MSVLVLGLETSCDETSAAVIEDGRKIRSNIIASQIPVHQKYGGVVPELASRRHVEDVIPVIDQALSSAGVGLADLDAVGDGLSFAGRNVRFRVDEDELIVLEVEDL